MGRGRENQVLGSMYQVDDNSDGGDDVVTLVANMVSTAMVASQLMLLAFNTGQVAVGAAKTTTIKETE